MVLTDLLRTAAAVLGIIAGAILIGMGIGYYKIHDDLAQILKDANVPNPKYVLLGLGILIVIISALGFLSMVRESLICKIIFWIILGGLIAFFGILAILVFYYRGVFLDQTREKYDEIWDHREIPHFKRMIDSMNGYFKCCGKWSIIDYQGKPPPSCCDDDPSIPVCSRIYQDGCRNKIVDYVSAKAVWIGSISIFVAVALLLVAI